MCNCSSVIIGKKASKTGRVILGHNEDDENVIASVYIIPHRFHKKSETLSFEKDKSTIPQAPETYGYFWSEMRSNVQEASFGDTFVNERGVAIASNGCTPSREANDDRQDGGIGYGIRRLVAERAGTAREGVEIAVELIEKYGYCSSRSYQICDKDEGWALQIVKGKHYIAKRVPDDEVMFIPNWYTIHGCDFSDTSHQDCYFSKGLADYAMEHGWYTPARENDYGDFNFAGSYQAGGDESYNVLRAKAAWRLLLGREPENIKQFSAKPDKKIGVEDVKKILRYHYEGTEDDITDSYSINPHMDHKHHFAICNALTQDSCIVEFDEDPALTCILHAMLNPCTSPYVPWYLGISRAPGFYGLHSLETAQDTHFAPPEADMEYNSEKIYWTYRTLKRFADADYKNVHGVIQNSIKDMEAKWNDERRLVHRTYKELHGKDTAVAIEYLTGYTEKQAILARDWAEDMTRLLSKRQRNGV